MEMNESFWLLQAIETTVITLGILVFIFGMAGFIYRFYAKRVEAKAGAVLQEELDSLKNRLEKLEAQLVNKKVPERLAVLEEIVTSEDFDLKRKLREVEKVKSEGLGGEGSSFA